MAAWSGNPGAVGRLIQTGADVSAVSNCGVTALSAAGAFDHVGAAAVLLEHGADANQPQIRPAPLYCAVMLGHKQMVDLLLRHGADPNAASADDTTAMAAAAGRANGGLDIQWLLLDAGAGSPDGLGAAAPCRWSGGYRLITYGLCP